jgi:hypothetical protein
MRILQSTSPSGQRGPKLRSPFPVDKFSTCNLSISAHDSRRYLDIGFSHLPHTTRRASRHISLSTVNATFWHLIATTRDGEKNPRSSAKPKQIVTVIQTCKGHAVPGTQSVHVMHKIDEYVVQQFLGNLH